jgi:hypothetical protein
MSAGNIHQLFTDASALDAAWKRYADLVKETEAKPELRGNRDHVDRMLSAFAEYQRLYNLRESQEARS